MIHPTQTVHMPAGPPPQGAGTSLGDPSGDALAEWVDAILPLWRCITGDGLRATLHAIGDQVPILLTEVPTGTPVLDWNVPKEWHVTEATITRADGTRVVDAAASPLHLVQYSAPVAARISLADLRPHLHTLPETPDWIPYRTDYYSDGWGFCLRQSTLDALANEVGETGELDVVIDAELFDGSLTYGEVVVPGQVDDEILITAHACHPALANDNASSLAVATALARQLVGGSALRHTVRFLFAPGTIGAIAWLDANRQRVGRIRGGLVLANLGDAGGFTYKQSRPGTLDTPRSIDRAVPDVLRASGLACKVRPFSPFGYDERQFGSPGFNLPIGRLTRTPHGEYPEYHTSADDGSLIRPDALEESLEVLGKIVAELDRELDASDPAVPEERVAGAVLSRAPYGEPQLGRRGLYRFTDGAPHPRDLQQAISWVLNLGDGRHTLGRIAQRSGLPKNVVQQAVNRLSEADLIEQL
ncbi:MAG: DUF4910 domain-containing protein [Bacteroidota bacterium]